MRAASSGSCASSANSGSTSSRSAIVVTQQRAQALAAALHAHLERRFADAGHSGHLGVLEPFGIFEEQRLSLQRIELRERTREPGVLDAELEPGLRRRRRFNCDLVLDEATGSPSTRRDEVATRSEER